MTWFHRITGFHEKDYAATQALLSVEEGRLVTPHTDARYAVGTLETPSLAELRARAADGGGAPSKVEIVTGDVRQLHAQAVNRGALFQVASQFNLLEMASQHVTPEQGVTRYAEDGTQGPACAMAAGAATIYRDYLVPVGGGIGQTRERQVDCLADLGAALGNEAAGIWRMQNGYAMFGGPGLARADRQLRCLGASAREDLKGLLRIGTHWNSDVTDLPPGHAVSQAFCSALPIGYHGGELRTDPRWEGIARLVLEAAYEATLFAARIHHRAGGSDLVYLTRIGGGVFANPPAWIHDAIRRAVDQVPGLRVRIVSHPRPDADLLALAR